MFHNNSTSAQTHAVLALILAQALINAFQVVHRITSSLMDHSALLHVHQVIQFLAQFIHAFHHAHGQMRSTLIHLLTVAKSNAQQVVQQAPSLIDQIKTV